MVTKVEDVGFTTCVKAVVEIVRGVGGVREIGIIDGHFCEGQGVVPVVSVEVGSAKKLLYGLVGTLREAIGRGWYAVRPCDNRRVLSKAVATIHW